MSITRGAWLALVVAMLCGVLAALPTGREPEAFASAKKAFERLRFVVELDLLETELLEDSRVIAAYAKNKSDVQRFYTKRSFSMAQECYIAYVVVAFIQTATDPDNKDRLLLGESYDLEVNELVRVFDQRAVTEMERAEFFIDYLEKEGFDTTKELKELDRARRGLEFARSYGTDSGYFRKLGSVFKRTNKIRLMARTAPLGKLEKCKKPFKLFRNLKGDEYCDGTLNGLVEQFQMGYGLVNYDRFGELTSVTVGLYACPIKSALPHWVELKVKPVLGPQEISGSYTRADGFGFGQNYRTGEVRVTGINLAAGYLAGEFDFTTKTTVCKNARFMLLDVKGFKREK